jgi:hypothetical protein
MFETRLPVDVAIHATCRAAAQRGFAMLFALLFVGIIGTVFLMYQLGNTRDSRYQIYFALGQEFALMARASHAYVQDHAYYSPYKDGAGAEQTLWLNYYEGLKDTRIASYRQPLGSPDNITHNVITLEDMQTSGIIFAGMDTSLRFNRPVRGVDYTIFAYGGLVPMHAPADLQAASALLVMYGRGHGGLSSDIRTAADMAAFRSGAASAGLNRIGIVLDPAVGKAAACHGGTAIVSWGTNENDCLTAAEASTIGMSLDKFDVVAPAWEAVEKQLTTKLVYRRPHPGLQGMNVMQQDLDMDSHKYRITDALEIYTETVNIDDGTDKNLFVGEIDPTTGKAPATSTGPSDAILTVARGHKTLAKYGGSGDVCNGSNGMVTTCFNGPVTVEENLAVSFKDETDNKYPPIVLGKDDPMLKVGGVVEVTQGNVTVNADETTFPDKGVFDVSNTDGTAHAVFNINKQDASGDRGTVINKKVTLGTFNVDSSDNSENFIVDKELSIVGGNVRIGENGTPSQVVLTKAPLASSNGTKLDIDTTGKQPLAGSTQITNSVYSSDVEANTLTQTGSKAMTFKNVTFKDGSTGSAAKVQVNRSMNVDDCVGAACPDNIIVDPPKGPL